MALVVAVFKVGRLRRFAETWDTMAVWASVPRPERASVLLVSSCAARVVVAVGLWQPTVVVVV